MRRQGERKGRPALVSFSGIDGAGKSTQIGSLYTRLSQAGLRVRVLAFWDDIALLGRSRELMSRALFKGEGGVGAPGAPVNRRDKNVTAWYLIAARFVLYFLDAVSLIFVVAKTLHSDIDVAIFDRYLYDELANLSLKGRVTRAYVRWLLRFVPQPDVAYLLDADPFQARNRKPEYPLEFLHSNRASYLALREFAGGIIVIPPLPVSQIEGMIMQEMLEKLPGDGDNLVPQPAVAPADRQ